MSENMETTVAPWKAIADMWNTYFTQPSRVSPEESRKYREWLSEMAGRSKKVLLLGVTPEIRNSLAELGFDVTCIDINKEMITAMNSVLEQTNPDEKIINENWLDNTLPDRSFDIVIGDAVLPNVIWDDREKLLHEVRRVLKPEGLFLTRAFCVPRVNPFKDIDDILAKYRGREPTYRNALEMVLDIQILIYNPADHLGTFSGPRDVLEKVREKNGFDFGDDNLKKIVEMVWDFWCVKYVKKAYTYAYRDEEEDEYRKIFTIIRTYEAQDNPYSDITPMYILRLN